SASRGEKPGAVLAVAARRPGSRGNHHRRAAERSGNRGQTAGGGRAQSAPEGRRDSAADPGGENEQEPRSTETGDVLAGPVSRPACGDLLRGSAQGEGTKFGTRNLE